MKYTKWMLLAVPALALTAFVHGPKYAPVDEPRTSFFDKAGMDTTVSPGENFFLYANGNWIKNTEMPASETRWGSFNILADNNVKRLHTILEDVSSKNNPIGTNAQKVGDLYKSGMDTVTIDKLGYSPIKPELAKIAAVTNYKQLVQLAADGFKTGDGLLFGFYIAPDARISDKNAAQLSQAEIGLPNRDYYFKTDSASVNIRAEYVKYIAKLFTLTGVDAATADKKAAAILKLETDIAQAHLSPVELRDPVKNYNKYSVVEFQKQVPDIDLTDVFTRIGIKTDTIIVGQPAYYKTLNELLKTTPIAVWKDKVAFDEISGAAPLLSKPFRDESFYFNSTVLTGQKQQKDRWKIMSQTIDGSLGELLGQLYAEKYFTPQAKKRMLDLVNNLQAVYRERIQKLDWMSDVTKQKALAKLDAFTKKIGYPDKWKTYDDVTINKATYYANEVSIAKHDFRRMINKLGKPVDRTEWGMTPPTVNAYYNPSYNEIVFPAGILQFPFFDENADDAVNYGGIGMVIGHEMTHGFDDQGRQFDKNGNLSDWWTPEDATKFKAKVQVMIDQYDGFKVLGGSMHVNGHLTQGENLADNGGIAIAYEAFKRTPQGQSNVKIDGFTPDQRFFLSVAQIWRSKIRDEALRYRINNDPHSPSEFRVNGPVSNTPAFYQAFNIKPGDKMYRPDSLRVKVW
jgi:putative endopeptidase